MTSSAYFRALLSLTSLSVLSLFQLFLQLSFGVKGLFEEYFLVSSSRRGRLKFCYAFSARPCLVFVPSKVYRLIPKDWLCRRFRPVVSTKTLVPFGAYIAL